MENYRIIGLIGLAMALASLFTPWIEVSSIVGSMKIYGFTTDGVFTFILLLISLGLLLTSHKKWKPTTVIILSLIGLIIVGIVVSNVSKYMGTTKLVYSVWGIGAPLMILASLTFILAGIFMSKKRPS